MPCRSRLFCGILPAGWLPANRCLPLVLNVIWILLFGWEIALAHLVSAALLTITIIGIPFGIAHIRLAGVALMPVGKEIVPKHARTTYELVRPVR